MVVTVASRRVRELYTPAIQLSAASPTLAPATATHKRDTTATPLSALANCPRTRHLQSPAVCCLDLHFWHRLHNSCSPRPANMAPPQVKLNEKPEPQVVVDSQVTMISSPPWWMFTDLTFIDVLKTCWTTFCLLWIEGHYGRIGDANTEEINFRSVIISFVYVDGRHFTGKVEVFEVGKGDHIDLSSTPWLQYRKHWSITYVCALFGVAHHDLHADTCSLRAPSSC